MEEGLTYSILANNCAQISLSGLVVQLGRLSFLQDGVCDAGDASSLRDVGAW